MAQDLTRMFSPKIQKGLGGDPHGIFFLFEGRVFACLFLDKGLVLGRGHGLILRLIKALEGPEIAFLFFITPTIKLQIVAYLIDLCQLRLRYWASSPMVPRTMRPWSASLAMTSVPPIMARAKISRFSLPNEAISGML